MSFTNPSFSRLPSPTYINSPGFKPFTSVINNVFVENYNVKEKYQRLKSLKKLRETEEMLCKRLELPAHDAGIHEIPTKKQLNEIEENIKYMENQLVCLHTTSL